MPAYFNISVQFKREDLYPDFMYDFYAALTTAGLKFQSSYYEKTELSEKQIIEWNQQKIEQNFKLGFTEHCVSDYKQTVFSFGNYTEVRGFWLNHYSEDGAFDYEIIIPESDVLTDEIGTTFQEQEVDKLLELSKKIWQFPYVRAIQTGLEFEDETTALSDIEKGELPNVIPFAILEQQNTQFFDSKYAVSWLPEKRSGILLVAPYTIEIKL